MEQENKILERLRQFSKTMPHFPDGRIDYHNAKKAFVITCVVKCKDELLLLKRSNEVWTYKGKWNFVAGYLDEIKPLKQKAMEELNEETRITKENIKEIKLGEPYEFYDKDIPMTFVVNPVLIELKEKPKIELDFEHTEAKWLKKEEIKKYDVIPNVFESMKKVI